MRVRVRVPGSEAALAISHAFEIEDIRLGGYNKKPYRHIAYKRSVQGM